MLAFITPVYANDYIKPHVPNLSEVGEGRLTYLFWDVYDAELLAPNGEWKAEGPYALRLSYLRNIEGEKIADRSIEEMRDQGNKNEVQLAGWHTQMNKIFPDVQDGTTLSGICTKQQETIFFEDGKEIGRIKDPEFTRAFFNIWLSEKTSAPDLREKLLRQASDER